jgi:hypothetical protein
VVHETDHTIYIRRTPARAFGATTTLMEYAEWGGAYDTVLLRRWRARSTARSLDLVFSIGGEQLSNCRGRTHLCHYRSPRAIGDAEKAAKTNLGAASHLPYCYCYTCPIKDDRDLFVLSNVQ